MDALTDRLIRGIESIALPAIAEGTAARAELIDLLDDALYPTAIARAEHVLALCTDGETTEQCKALRAALRIGDIRALGHVLEMAKAFAAETELESARGLLALGLGGNVAPFEYREQRPNIGPSLQEYPANAVRTPSPMAYKKSP